MGPPIYVRFREKRIKNSLQSRKMKHFCFSMFYNQPKFCKKSRDNIVAIEKVHIQNCYEFILWNEKSIIYKRKNRNWDF